MFEINFAHEYHKLRELEFTTMRGVSYLQKIRMVREARILVRKKYRYDARVCNAFHVRIQDLSLDFLKKDAEYPGFFIHSLDDFINLVNSFYPRNRFPNLKINEKSKMTVVRLEKRRQRGV